MRQDLMRDLLDRWGQEGTVETADGTAAGRAFLQPLAERGEAVPQQVTSIGWTDERLWLYLGRTVLSSGNQVIWNDRTFRVRSCRPYYIGRELTHYWAVLEQATEAAM